MFPQNIIPSSNNLQRRDFGSPTGIVACKDLASLSSMNIFSCFVNPLSTYSLRGGTVGKWSPGHTGHCCLSGLNPQPKVLCEPPNHLPLLRVSQHWPHFKLPSRHHSPSQSLIFQVVCVVSDLKGRKGWSLNPNSTAYRDPVCAHAKAEKETFCRSWKQCAAPSGCITGGEEK